MQSLAEKYRPKTLDDVIGQEKVVARLKALKGRGGNRYTLRTARTVQRRTTGAVNSVDGNTAINRAVWQLAEEMVKLKA